MNLSMGNFLFPILGKTKNTVLDLFKIMIPIIIVIKLIQELNLLIYLVYPFSYIMNFLGIPDVYALVWLSSIFNTCYIAITLISLLFKDYPLTVEQVSILGMMILISHSLFIEGAIAHHLKVNGFFSAFLRVLSSLSFGYLIHITCQYFGILQEIATSPFFHGKIIFNRTLLDLYNAGILLQDISLWMVGLRYWLYQQIRTLIMIIIVIFVLFCIVQTMKTFNLVAKIDALFKPFLSIMKINKSNFTVTTLCYVIGISYGYGLLKEEKEKSKDFSSEQSFIVMSFLAIAHAIVEDGIIFILLGANGWLMILGRTAWGIIVVAILARVIVPKLSNKTKNRFLYKIEGES